MEDFYSGHHVGNTNRPTLGILSIQDSEFVTILLYTNTPYVESYGMANANLKGVEDLRVI